jgi:hypothetical protein
LKSLKSRITKEITSVDLGGADLVHGFEKGRSEPSVQTVPSRSGDRRSHSIAGDWRCANFKKLRAGRNPNPGFGERTRGGSRRIAGRKVVWFQTTFGRMPTIVCLHEVITQGHIRGGAKRKGANANSETSLKREGEGRGYHKTCTRSQKGLCLIKR